MTEELQFTQRELRMMRVAVRRYIDSKQFPSNKNLLDARAVRQKLSSMIKEDQDGNIEEN